MDKRIVLDLETQKTFDEVGGRAKLDKVGISVVGLYQYATQEYQVFEEKDLGAVQNILINASVVIGFNHVQFDLPVLQPYCSIDLGKLPTLDIMLELQAKLGHRIGLDSVALGTLGIGKTGHGLDAIRFWKEGKMTELKDYCQNDVKVTKEIFDHGLAHGKVTFIAKYGRAKTSVDVDWSRYSPTSRAPEAVATNFAQYKLF